MKNASPEERRALRERAAQIANALPALHPGGDTPLCRESEEAVRALARRILQRNRAVGASFSIVFPSEKSASFCFGRARLSPAVPVTPGICFRVASVSKLVMAFGALSLHESGELPLDGDISDYLGYPVRNPHAPHIPVTMRMLLTHTAALTDDGPYGTRGMQPGCTLKSLLADPACWAKRPPGESFHYTNLGAGVAGVVMERASGIPFDDLMRDRVFSPLGVRASYDPRRIAPAGDLADGYSVRGLLPPRRKYDAAALSSRPSEPFDPERDYLIAAGRMIADTPGMQRLVRLLASHGEMGVLSRESLDLMRACQDGMGGVASCGRGLNTAFLPDVFDGFSPVGHQGVAYGMCAELFADPARGCGVGIMTSGVRLVQRPPLVRAGFDLLALGFGVISRLESP